MWYEKSTAQKKNRNVNLIKEQEARFMPDLSRYCGSISI